MTHKMISIRIPLGLYEILEREALDRHVAVAQVIVERLEKTMEVRAIGFQLAEAPK